jgi:hypothetical protein
MWVCGPSRVGEGKPTAGRRSGGLAFTIDTVAPPGAAQGRGPSNDERDGSRPYDASVPNGGNRNLVRPAKACAVYRARFGAWPTSAHLDPPVFMYVRGDEGILHYRDVEAAEALKHLGDARDWLNSQPLVLAAFGEPPSESAFPCGRRLRLHN